MENLKFFEKEETGNLLCFTTEGLIVAKKGMSEKQVKMALESGDDVREVEGEWKGKPTKTILVGFGDSRDPVMEFSVKKIQVRRSSGAVAVEITYLD